MRNHFTLFLVLFFTTIFYAQTNGIAYQAVLYKPNVQTLPGAPVSTSPMVNTAVCLRFTFLDGNDAVEYQETVSTQTDQYGIVNTTIGTGNQTGGTVAAFGDLQWNVNDKTLVVELDEKGSCTSFTEISRQAFSTAPFAFNAVTANNVSGIVAVVNGGTGADNAEDALINLSAEDILNKSVDVVVDANSNQKYPSVKAIKTYVDQEVLAATTEEKVLDYKATFGQTQFKTPSTILNSQNVNVYRNGIRVNVTVVDSNTVELESGVVCYADDEIKIMQFNYKK